MLIIKEAIKEISNISWINKKELMMMSASVFFIVFLFAIFFLLVDLAFSNIINFLI